MTRKICKSSRKLYSLMNKRKLYSLMNKRKLYSLERTSLVQILFKAIIQIPHNNSILPNKKVFQVYNHTQL